MNFYNKTLIYLLSFCVLSCNLLSTENISNNFLFRKKRFEKQFDLRLDYTPVKTSEIENNFFYKNVDVNYLDDKYEIKNILNSKFKKRNINFVESSDFSLKIDTLLFKEFQEEIPVYSNSNVEFISNENKKIFIFKIVGSLKLKDSVLKINVKKEHVAWPRESYIIKGNIGHSGINAKAEKMIENTISIFSNLVYEKLN